MLFWFEKKNMILKTITFGNFSIFFGSYTIHFFVINNNIVCLMMVIGMFLIVILEKFFRVFCYYIFIFFLILFIIIIIINNVNIVVYVLFFFSIYFIFISGCFITIIFSNITVNRFFFLYMIVKVIFVMIIYFFFFALLNNILIYIQWWFLFHTTVIMIPFDHFLHRYDYYSNVVLCYFTISLFVRTMSKVWSNPILNVRKTIPSTSIMLFKILYFLFFDEWIIVVFTHTTIHFYDSFFNFIPFSIISSSCKIYKLFFDNNKLLLLLLNINVCMTKYIIKKIEMCFIVKFKINYSFILRNFLSMKFNNVLKGFIFIWNKKRIFNCLK